MLSGCLEPNPPIAERAHCICCVRKSSSDLKPYNALPARAITKSKTPESLRSVAQSACPVLRASHAHIHSPARLQWPARESLLRSPDSLDGHGSYIIHRRNVNDGKGCKNEGRLSPDWATLAINTSDPYRTMVHIVFTILCLFPECVRYRSDHATAHHRQQPHG